MGRFFRANAGGASARLAVAGMAVAAGTMAVCAPAAAAWPERPITLIVPFPPGGTTDIFARTIAEHMRPALGQSIVVENKPGAAGNLGVAAATRAQPDGYTIVLGSVGTQSVNQFLYSNIGFNPATDLVPLGMICLLYTSPSPRDRQKSRMPSSA